MRTPAQPVHARPGAPPPDVAADRVQRERIDWGQFWYPGPRRVFTDAELAQAGGQALSPTLVAVLLFNCALLAGMVLIQAPATATPVLTGLLVLAGVLGMAGTRALWRRPTRRGLSLWTFGATLALVVSTGVICENLPAPRGTPLRGWIMTTGLGAGLLLTVGWGFAVVYRAHQIEARLREQAEQQRALDMARQLAAAQIQPHFLFNALASLQHWVHTKDDRAAPLLDALTGFLRATLPLFNRERLALGDEALAVREYLAVTGLRLGERLRWSVQISPEVQAEQVPPGLLLTLVENAIEHGVQASLAGAAVDVRAWREGDASGGVAGGPSVGQVVLQVQDSGPGPAPGWVDGVGLANSRLRLTQAFGPAAQLSLAHAPEGGCVARIVWPAPVHVQEPAVPPSARTASLSPAAPAAPAPPGAPPA